MIKNCISNASLGIELGSTRIKSVLINDDFEVIATGNWGWKSTLAEGIWSYSEDAIWEGIQNSYLDLQKNVKRDFQLDITEVSSIGFSGMMHGYLPFDSKENLLVPFRTWRNTITEEAKKELTKLFNHNIPQRWSVAHLYQAVINEEKHLSKLDFMTTLSGYVHWKLTGRKVLGIGDASGMFPIDTKNKNYNKNMISTINKTLQAKNYNIDIQDILPQVLVAGEDAGYLTKKGALMIDPTGKLKDGIPMCPPEGDAGTGMVATNSVAARSGNASVGTSLFAMVVLEKKLNKIYEEIDIVTTPSGEPVAMVHTVNCSSDIDAWINLFKEVLDLMGYEINMGDLYETLFKEALKADNDRGGLLSYGLLAGENILNLNEGRPLFVRKSNSNFTIANFMKTQLNSAFATLSIGMRTLYEENVKIDKFYAHGGLFKTDNVAQSILASALETSVTLLDTAGEGGAWGMAVLAKYLIDQKNQALDSYLNNIVFDKIPEKIYEPQKKEILEYREFIKDYKNGLDIEQTAIDKF